ncbi:MAG: tetratricopeptide repeat protein [Leptolyngbya sp. RL_3_1]|nr:tetratricopeptide repeat protein [Leptolyngbya sp. RL_3_1]
MALGDTAGAIADYQQALSLGKAVPDETQANIYNDLGVAYLAQAQPVVAVAYLDQAIFLNHDDPRAYFNHGCACHHRGDNLTALASFEQALALDPTHAETYLNRAMVRGELGDQRGAMTDLQQAQTYFQQRGDQRGSNQARSLLMQWQRQSIAIG